jgi:hypothetical protein
VSLRRAAHFLAVVALSWLLMQVVHELGHVLGSSLSGGTVERVVLHPLTISRTDIADDPRPLLTLWAGPVMGVVLPLIGILLARRCGPSLSRDLRFFAGFCPIANGAYVGYGSFDGIGDAGELLRHGAPLWSLWLFGAATIVAGFGLWHQLGPWLGWHPSLPRPTWRYVIGLWLVLALVVLLECAFSPR